MLASKYAQVRGVPLPWLGVIFYLVVLGLWLVIYAVPSRRTRLGLLDGLLWLVIVGLTFSAGLMYLQFAVLRAFCPLCTTSALLVTALLFTLFRVRRRIAEGNAGASPGGAAQLALFAVVPLGVFAMSLLAADQSPNRLLLADLSAAHRLGPADAPVQLVVFSDFQCGFCRELAPILRRLQEEFPGKVAVVFCHFPLAGHPRAFPAAIAAECAGEQGAFWPFHDQLFAANGNLDEASFLAVAAALGLDQARFAACLHSERPRQQVEANMREGMQLGLEGTPTVFLNGRRVEGPLSHDDLVRRIKEALAPR